MRKYVPRRASLKRWLEGAPEYVLDCFYDKKYNSYDVLFCGTLLGTINGEPQDLAHVYIIGLEVDPDGARASFELNAYDAARYRYRSHHKRVAWAKLPLAVRRAVKAWAAED